MVSSFQEGTGLFCDFDYSPDKVHAFYERVVEKRGEILEMGSFMRNIDVDRLLKVFSECTTAQKDDIRGAFLTVYRVNDARTLLSSDCDSIKLLQGKLKEALSGDVGDRIHRLQYQMFIENLAHILDKASPKIPLS